MQLTFYLKMNIIIQKLAFYYEIYTENNAQNKDAQFIDLSHSEYPCDPHPHWNSQNRHDN